jgi:hypothetical protein
MLLVATIVMSAHAAESLWLEERLRAHRAARGGSYSHQSTIDNERLAIMKCASSLVRNRMGPTISSGCAIRLMA